MLETQEAFLRELGRHISYWTESAADAINSPVADLNWADDPEAFRRLGSVLREAGVQRDFRIAVRNLLYGVLHSTLVTFDGGTALADRTQLTIRDSDGQDFDRFLHELLSDLMGEA